MVYNRISQKIYSNSETRIEDFEGNIYTVQDNFNLDLDKEIISTKKINVIDNNNNIYYFEDSKIDLVNKEIAGKELKIDFIDSYFGNENDPVLKGRSAISNDMETKIYKTVFTTCNTENKSCPDGKLKPRNLLMIKLIKHLIIKILG